MIEGESMKDEKYICDICKIKEADVKFKVKINERKGRFTQGYGARNRYFGFGNWEKIDICDSCYKKILGVELHNQIRRPIVPPCA